MSFGHVIPSFTSTAIAVNFAHRAGAVVVLIAILVAARRRMTIPLIGIVTLQIALGAMTVWSGKHPIITSLHVMTGAATLAMTLIYALTDPATEQASALVASEVAA